MASGVGGSRGRMSRSEGIAGEQAKKELLRGSGVELSTERNRIEKQMLGTLKTTQTQGCSGQTAVTFSVLYPCSL